MVIVKNLDSSVDWAITHSGLPGNRSLRFTTASKDTSGFLGLNKGGLASTYFTINYTDTNLKYVNANNEDYIFTAGTVSLDYKNLAVTMEIMQMMAVL